MYELFTWGANRCGHPIFIAWFADVYDAGMHLWVLEMGMTACTLSKSSFRVMRVAWVIPWQAGLLPLWSKISSCPSYTRVSLLPSPKQICVYAVLAVVEGVHDRKLC
jgi:hypothetical protein